MCCWAPLGAWLCARLGIGFCCWQIGNFTLGVDRAEILVEIFFFCYPLTWVCLFFLHEMLISSCIWKTEWVHPTAPGQKRRHMVWWESKMLSVNICMQLAAPAMARTKGWTERTWIRACKSPDPRTLFKELVFRDVILLSVKSKRAWM